MLVCNERTVTIYKSKKSIVNNRVFNNNGAQYSVARRAHGRPGNLTRSTRDYKKVVKIRSLIPGRASKTNGRHIGAKYGECPPIYCKLRSTSIVA